MVCIFFFTYLVVILGCEFILYIYMFSDRERERETSRCGMVRYFEVRLLYNTQLSNVTKGKDTWKDIIKEPLI